MSRDLGRVELRILQLLEGGRRLRPSQIALEIAGSAEPTDALRASVGRALTSLRRKGQLVRMMGDWVLAETSRRAEMQRAHEEDLRKRREAQERREERTLEGRVPVDDGADLTPDSAVDGPVDYRIEGRRLIKILALLGSPHEGEVLNAARQAEQVRRRLRLSWQELITLPDHEEIEATQTKLEYGPNFSF